MIEDIKALTVCIYCDRPIITTEPGYGYYESPDKHTKTFYHSECLNVEEDIEIA